MSVDIRRVKDMNGLITYLAEKLSWRIDLDDFEDIEDIAYDFEAEDIGLKEEAFVKIQSLRQLPPLVDGQKWGIFCVEFDSKRFEVTALRKILSGLIPKRRNSADHAVWDQKDLLFICFWGSKNERTIGLAHFEDVGSGLPQIKMISCCPAVEDFTQIKVFEDRLKNLKWPANYVDHKRWQEDWSEAFTTGYRQTIQDASTLTVQLAIEAQGIKNRILEILDVETANGYVHLLYEKFKNTLIHDMTETQFADMYAQTVVYGLFSARCMDETQEDFSAAEAVDCIPSTNPFLKSLMKECLGSQNNSKLSFDELEIGNVVDLLLHTKTEAIIQDFNRQTGGGREDPVIHFYEEFLTAYDKSQKVQRGVYYTPQPVVNFIVRAVDYLIKKEFGLEDGLASTETKKIKYLRESKRRVDGFYRTQVEDTKEVPAIQILDPSTGTGTFIRQTILQIYNNFKEKHNTLSSTELNKAWNTYVPQNLLPRLNAFELMMAPYAVAHMKLAMVLKDTGYDFQSDGRLNVFLTNTLEKAGTADAQMTIFDDPLASESIAANAVKKNDGISILMGNPPYLSASNNNGDFISSLMKDYKKEPGGELKLQERKNWLDDDYVKFIRWSQNILEKNGEGIVAFINPHGWLENGGFRGMRWMLMTAFDEIYVLNLHGNSKRQETCPDGSKDENVFDIQQGVCINIFVRKKNHSAKKLGKIFYADLYGTRDKKYSYLTKMNLLDIAWNQLKPEPNMYFMIPKDFSGSEEYMAGFPVAELFGLSSQGVMSGNDSCVMYPTLRLAEEIAKGIAEAPTVKEAEKLFDGKKMPKNWNLASAKDDLERGYTVERICYRPFDDVYSAYSGRSCGWHWRPRTETMMELSGNKKNIALVLTRIVQKGSEYNHVFVTNAITDKGMLSSKDNAFVFPLYKYSDEFGTVRRLDTLNRSIVKELANRINARFIDTADNAGTTGITAYDVFCYVYAILFTPTYRKTYKEFLIVDFPVIPFPKDSSVFWQQVKLGDELIQCHTSMKKEDLSPCFVGEDREVKKVEFKTDKCFINSSSYFIFDNKEIWEYTIGSYQPAQKWLKDRKGYILTNGEIEKYCFILSAIKRTISIMKELDAAW